MKKANPYTVFLFEPGIEGASERVVDHKPTLSDIQIWVKGYIQLIPRFTKYAGRSRGEAYANENGKLLVDLPFNRAATLAWLASASVWNIDTLVGPVVIIFKGESRK